MLESKNWLLLKIEATVKVWYQNVYNSRVRVDANSGKRKELFQPMECPIVSIVDFSVRQTIMHTSVTVVLAY